MRSRVITFITGFASGMVTLYIVLWSGGVFSPYLSGMRAQAIAQTAPERSGAAERARVPSPHAGLVLPIDGVTSANLHDTFNETRGGHAHDAIDIMEPRGTPVHAVVDGTIEKLFISKAGGNTIYQFDIPSEYCYYYAHLGRYADGIREGMHIAQGDVIAYVGSTGDANQAAPHLHFEIHVLGPEKHWWQGTPINPYPVLLSLIQR